MKNFIFGVITAILVMIGACAGEIFFYGVFDRDDQPQLVTAVDSVAPTVTMAKVTPEVLIEQRMLMEKQRYTDSVFLCMNTTLIYSAATAILVADSVPLSIDNLVDEYLSKKKRYDELYPNTTMSDNVKTQEPPKLQQTVPRDSSKDSIKSPLV